MHLQWPATIAGLQGSLSVGFIGEVKKFTLNFLPKIEETMETTISVVSEAMGITLINASTSVGGEVAATCQMKIFIREEQ